MRIKTICIDGIGSDLVAIAISQQLFFSLRASIEALLGISDYENKNDMHRWQNMIC